MATGETRDGPCVTSLTAVVMVEAAMEDAAVDTKAVVATATAAIRMVVAGAAAAVEEARDSSAVVAASGESRPGRSAITETRTETSVMRTSRTRKASAGANTSQETTCGPEPPLLSPAPTPNDRPEITGSPGCDVHYFQPEVLGP